MSQAAIEISGERLPRMTWQIILLMVLGCLLSLMFVKLAWTDGDEGRYLQLAESVAQGSGVSDIYLPETKPERFTPPLHVYYLAAWVRLFDNPAVIRLSSVLLMSLFIGMFVVSVFHCTGWRPVVNAATVVLGSMTVSILAFSWTVFSEPLFLFFLYSCLLLGATYNDRPWQAAGLGVLGALSMLTRQVGIALLIAIFVFLLFRKRWKNVFFFLIALGIIYLPELLRVYHLTGYPVGYMAFYESATPEKTNIMLRFLTSLRSFGGYYFDYMPKSMFYSLLDGHCLMGRLGLGFLIRPLAILIALLVGAGFFIRLRWLQLSEFFWVIYWLIMCSYNQPDYEDRGVFLYQPRYLVIVLPLAALYLFTTIDFVAQHLHSGRWYKPIVYFSSAAILCYILGTSMIAAVRRVHTEWRWFGTHAWDPNRIASTGDECDVAFARYIEVGLWSGTNLATNAVIASRKPEHTYLFSKRKGFRYDMDWMVEAGNAWGNMLAYRIYGPVYILQDAFPANTGYGLSRVGTIDPIINGHRSELELVYETKEPVTRLWRIESK